MIKTTSASSESPEIGERDIQRSKCLLNAAIPASLNGKNAADVMAVKQVAFEILDSEDPVYIGAKGALIEGDLFDAAKMLEFRARRMPDRAALLYMQAAVLYAPVMTVKSIICFEQAQSKDTDLGPYRSMMVRLYERMGDSKAAQAQKALADVYLAENPEADIPVTDDNIDEISGNNVTYISFGA